jgi:arginine decarboxylase
MRNITLEEVLQTYGVENWGAGYFEVNRKGHLAVRPAEGDPRLVDIKELIDHLVDQRKLQLPILLRFPQILTNQLKKLHRSFAEASREFSYTGGHYPVFPMKVNPRRSTSEWNAGRRQSFTPRSRLSRCRIPC